MEHEGTLYIAIERQLPGVYLWPGNYLFSAINYLQTELEKNKVKFKSKNELEKLFLDSKRPWFEINYAVRQINDLDEKTKQGIIYEAINTIYLGDPLRETPISFERFMCYDKYLNLFLETLNLRKDYEILEKIHNTRHCEQCSA